MKSNSANIFNILVPVLLLLGLMLTALINYPVILEKAKGTVAIVFIALPLYVFLWKVVKPDNFSKNGGLWIGFLFILNISLEEFVDWQAKNSTLISTLVMMALIFISFSIISAIKTIYSGDFYKGLKSSFISAILGTIIALCFGFLIDFIFRNKMVFTLKNYPGYGEYSKPMAFVYFNSFDNAANHVIVAPTVSIFMGGIGGIGALIILKQRKRGKSP